MVWRAGGGLFLPVAPFNGLPVAGGAPAYKLVAIGGSAPLKEVAIGQVVVVGGGHARGPQVTVQPLPPGFDADNNAVGYLAAAVWKGYGFVGGARAHGEVLSATVFTSAGAVFSAARLLGLLMQEWSEMEGA